MLTGCGGGQSGKGSMDGVRRAGVSRMGDMQEDRVGLAIDGSKSFCAMPGSPVVPTNGSCIESNCPDLCRAGKEEI